MKNKKKILITLAIIVFILFIVIYSHNSNFGVKSNDAKMVSITKNQVKEKPTLEEFNKEQIRIMKENEEKYLTAEKMHNDVSSKLGIGVDDEKAFINNGCKTDYSAEKAHDIIINFILKHNITKEQLKDIYTTSGDNYTFESGIQNNIDISLEEIKEELCQTEEKK